MTFDEWLATIGLALAGIAAVAGIVAAIYAIRADRASRAGSKDELQRWQRSIQPRPKIHIETSAGVDQILDSISLTISNPGGSATQGFVLVQLGRGYYGTGFNIAQHAGPLSWSGVPKVGETPVASSRRILAVVAQDVDGNWWDCGNDAILTDFPPDGVGSVKFNVWLNRRIQEVQQRDRDVT